MSIARDNMGKSIIASGSVNLANSPDNADTLNIGHVTDIVDAYTGAVESCVTAALNKGHVNDTAEPSTGCVCALSTLTENIGQANDTELANSGAVAS